MADHKATGALSRAPMKPTAKHKKSLTLKQQVALFYARKRRKARASS